MTRNECIEAMARASFGVWDSIDDWDTAPTNLKDEYRIEATAAYDAMAEHIRAREEAVREMCAKQCGAVISSLGKGSYPVPNCSIDTASRISNAIRALDIGGGQSNAG